jgi:L-threonylcarbamoyladenylate synthase
MTNIASVRPFQTLADHEVMSEAHRLLQAGGVIAMPTDTLYALGACAMNEAAVRRVCAIKGRDAGKPIPVLIGDRFQLEGLVTDVSPTAAILIDHFWPGPLTIVFPASVQVPRLLTAGTEAIGIRLPAHRLLQTLLRITGPLTGTSANRSGAPPAQTAQEVEATLGPDIDLILDGGPSTVTSPSTVVAVGKTVRVLREGPIDRGALRGVLAAHRLAAEVE